MEGKLVLEPDASKEDIANAQHIWDLEKEAPGIYGSMARHLDIITYGAVSPSPILKAWLKRG